MKKLIIMLALLCAPAFGAQQPDALVVTGPAFQQMPVGSLPITLNGTQQTLANALAAGGCTTNCSFTNPAITGGSISGASVAATTLNATGATGLQIGGLNGLTISSAANEPNFLSGPFAGASAPSNGQFITAVAPYAFESMTSAAAESAAVGQGAGISATTSGGIATVGISSCASQTISGCTALGNDAARDAWDTGNSPIAIGPGCYGDVAGTGNNICIGDNTLGGASSLLTFTGTATVGDVLHFAVSSANSCNGTTITVNCTSGAPQPINYTAVTGDTTAATLATHVAAALTNGLTGSQLINYVLGDGVTEGNHNLFAVQFAVADSNHTNVVKGHYPNSWQLSIAYTCTGSCTGTVTTAGPTAPGSVTVVGTASLGYAGIGTPVDDAILGNGILIAAVNPQNLVVAGAGAAQACNTNCSNAVVIGNVAASAATAIGQDVLVGAWIGGLTSGTGNTIVSDETTSGSGGVTSGSQNLELALGANVPSPTASYQMSIQNIIYGTGNSGTGSTVSPGSVGIGQKAPNARFDVLGVDTSSSTGAFRVQNSTPALAFEVFDDTHIQVGAGAFTANGSTALSLTSLGPSGSHATVQEWLTITDSSGTVRYIPAF